MFGGTGKYFFSILLIFLSALPAYGSNIFPLEPPDTSSPKATLRSFIHYTDELYAEATADNAKDNIVLLKEYLQRAERCFNLSLVPPTLRDSVSIESVLRLREILDRIELPDMNDVPDKHDVKKQGVLLWRIPHTEIKIGKVVDGPRIGSFLFTPETVERLEGFYYEVKDLPYRSDKSEGYRGFYEQYIYSSGWMIPDGFLKSLPEWMRKAYYGQAVWQWIGLDLIILVCAFSLWLVWLWHRTRSSRSRKAKWQLDRLIFPFYGMLLCVVIKYFAVGQIMITGDILAYLTIFLGFWFSVSAGVLIIIAGNVVMHGIISSTKINEEALDADVIKLLCRLGSFGLVFVLFYKVGGYFGIPVTAIFASAGIAGVAVALAARETLANFFGGVSIFMDRPFRAGDYIVLDSGERGEVKAVGMRSTRLLTRDDIMITIPNSVITNSKIVNQSMPLPSFRIRIKLGVAYGTDLDQLESILLELANENSLVISNPEPRVRFRNFGDSALEFELLCWASRPHDRGKLIHELNKAIYSRLNVEGISIPFPQREIHIHKTED
ncbi:mechanosensitive ion channel family protein [Maridesulfovibrio zosterae]|uniref:mechanosensitive ion channel family protein n=1 Tax=Maridesulfovibrio zosterae TaxID=82171 RepID=UPI0003F8BF22|nr:mechanosensitive ion channel family protein [Maridesulfovibrio zosterae]